MGTALGVWEMGYHTRCRLHYSVSMYIRVKEVFVNICTVQGAVGGIWGQNQSLEGPIEWPALKIETFYA
jgi:hypothetical protein